jgi:hypothetical protein
LLDLIASPRLTTVYWHACRRFIGKSNVKIIKYFNSALDRGLIKQVFDHIRNYLIGAFILAIGTTELRQQEREFFDLVPAAYAGWGVISLAAILISLNLYEGIRRISKSKYHFVFTIALVLLYLFLSVRVIEMAWDYRDLAETATL